MVGLNPIDESWWCGERYGKQGIFPINFVWRINEDIIEVGKRVLFQDLELRKRKIERKAYRMLVLIGKG